MNASMTSTANTSSPSLKSSREYVASASSGYSMLLLLLILAAAIGVTAFSALGPGLVTTIVTVCSVAFVLVLKGFYVLQPNQAAVITLFGSYKGTDRATGLRWVWPWMGKDQAFGPRQQRHFGDDQGQRSARQPHRDGGAGGLARDRHRAGAV